MFEKILECENSKEVMELFNYNLEWFATVVYSMAIERERLLNELNELTSQIVENESSFSTDVISLFISQQMLD